MGENLQKLHRWFVATENGPVEDREQRHALGLRRNATIAPLNGIITAKYSIPGMKHALDKLGLQGGPVRRPLLPLSAEAKVEVEEALADANTKWASLSQEM